MMRYDYMDERAVEEEMYEKAVAFLNQRYGIHSGGVGIVRVDTGEYYISVWNETLNSCVDLCAETGAILEAHKYNKKITHSLCVARDEGCEEIKILTPCGVCQERLYFWGPDVKCAVSNKDNKLVFLPLHELQPYYWNLEHK